MFEINGDSEAERFAEIVAARVAERIRADLQKVLVTREELATLTGLGIRTIDRMAAGGSREKCPKTGEVIWRESPVKLEPLRQGRKVVFDKAAALAAIRAGG